MSKPKVSRQVIKTALLYLNELVNYVHDVPEDLQECMDALAKAAEKKCETCNGTGECYFSFQEGTPIASSLGPCPYCKPVYK